MTTKITALLMATAFSLGTAAIAAHAADSSTFERQLEQTDGDVAPPTTVHATPRTKAATPWVAAQDAWFERERAQPTVVVPYIPPKATSTAIATDSTDQDTSPGQ
jgi:hypothetical protein